MYGLADFDAFDGGLLGGKLSIYLTVVSLEETVPLSLVVDVDVDGVVAMVHFSQPGHR